MSALRDTVGLKGIGAILLRDSVGLKNVAAGLVRDATNLRVFFTPMTATASPLTQTGFGFYPGAATINTPASTATPIGGVGPFTYAWATAAPDWVAVNPTSATTPFQASGVLPYGNTAASFICTITDANGATAQTPAVACTAANYYSDF